MEEEYRHKSILCTYGHKTAYYIHGWRYIDLREELFVRNICTRKGNKRDEELKQAPIEKRVKADTIAPIMVTTAQQDEEGNVVAPQVCNDSDVESDKGEEEEEESKLGEGSDMKPVVAEEGAKVKVGKKNKKKKGGAYVAGDEPGQKPQNKPEVAFEPTNTAELLNEVNYYEMNQD